MTSQTGMTMVYCCHHPYHEMVLYLPNARVTIPVLLTLGQLPHMRQPGWGELAGSQRLTQGNLNSLDPSPQHTFLLFRSHKPRLAVLVAVNTYASHPQSDRRSASMPSFCHSLSHFRMLPLGGRHQPAGCRHGLFSSEYIHGESSQT